MLADLLSKDSKNDAYLEKIISDKIELWDSGNWAEKMWQLNKSKGFEISHPKYYYFKKGKKVYVFREFLNEKIKAKELGENPILSIDYNLVFYDEGDLLKTTDTLTIKHIDYTPITKSIKFYGIRGKDGSIKILTK